VILHNYLVHVYGKLAHIRDDFLQCAHETHCLSTNTATNEIVLTPVGAFMRRLHESARIVVERVLVLLL
jgi:hypothetical protein